MSEVFLYRWIHCATIGSGQGTFRAGEQDDVTNEPLTDWNYVTEEIYVRTYHYTYIRILLLLSHLSKGKVGRNRVITCLWYLSVLFLYTKLKASNERLLYQEVVE